MNREEWLTCVASEFEAVYKQRGYPLSKYRLTCGWPCIRGLSLRNRRIGECHSAVTSKDGIHEIFISPTIDDSSLVAGVVAHELVHVAVGTKCGHKGPFVRAMRVLGLSGKPTQATAGARLKFTVDLSIKRYGEYPHKALAPVAHTVKPSSSLKLVCGECGCIVRISEKWLNESGNPVCGCGGLMQSE